MTIHYIDMDIIGPGVINRSDLFTESCEICGKN